MSISQAAWDPIDHIYCISLTHRKDRQAHAREQFTRVGIGNRVEFVLVNRHPTDCEQGIFESHQLCMKKGLDSGAEHILIFEDDIVFDKITPDIMTHCTTFLQTQTAWHILFLGCMVRGSRKTAFPSILKVRFRSLSHSYVIHRRLAKVIVQQKWQQVPYDDYLRDLNDDRFFALYPSIAFQSDSSSDNERYLPLDRFRRLCGGLKKIQRRNEFYHRHRMVVIGAHALLLILLFWVWSYAT